MKFRKSGQALLAAAVSVGVGLGITSCGQSNTVDYLFVTANKNNPGQISVYLVDQESGALTQIKESPYSSGGRNPVAEVTSPNGKNLYVINHDDNTIVQFGIGTDAKLYPTHTYNTPGSEPNALAINAAGTFLYVVDYYQATFTDTNPGPGALVAYPVNSDGSLGTPVANGNLPYFPVEFYPSGVNVTANGSFVYVVNTNTQISILGGTNNTSQINPAGQGGTISAFAVGSGGALTPIVNPQNGKNFAAGTAPLGATSDPTGRFLYVTDALQNQLLAYNILSTGILQPVNNGPFATGTFPAGVVVDPRGLYVYVTNYNGGSISEYSIDQGTGAPTAGASSTVTSGDAGPTCIIIEPSLGRYVYTSNFLGTSNVGGTRLNPNTGALTVNQNSPYPSAGQPTCVAAVPHGNHSSQNVSVVAGQ
jgi:6-phosphogluconolactonase